jgi:hypothetical protein
VQEQRLRAARADARAAMGSAAARAFLAVCLRSSHCLMRSLASGAFLSIA